MQKVMVLGSRGMLGSTVTKVLTELGFKTTEVNRSGIPIKKENSALRFNVLNEEVDTLFSKTNPPEYVINCIGLIKHKTNTNIIKDLEMYIQLNSTFPLKLISRAGEYGFKVIQIATDCVFSGEKGSYTELDVRDPVDAYGYSKALGEIRDSQVLTLRCSIIGRELASSVSLLEWVLSQPNNAAINGYINHFWNGITTFHFGRICAGLISNKEILGETIHLTPRDCVSKFDLISTIAYEFERQDLEIREYNATNTVDRTLGTINGKLVAQIWNQAGYASPPSIREMIHEYAQWSRLDSAHQN